MKEILQLNMPIEQSLIWEAAAVALMQSLGVHYSKDELMVPKLLKVAGSLGARPADLELQYKAIHDWNREQLRAIVREQEA